MKNKIVSAECLECESSFEVAYVDELVSEDVPCFCPFCGEKIEEPEDLDESFDDDYEELE